jgi:exopolysaccharide biosynthesis polyprenyl glycosylphosphotransferase
MKAALQEINFFVFSSFDYSDCFKQGNFPKPGRSFMGASSRRRVLVGTLKIFDTLVLSAVFFLAAVPVWRGGEEITFAEFLSMRIKVENFALFFALLAIWHVLFVSFGVYRSQRLAPPEEELKALFCATSSATTCVGIVALIFQIRMVTPTFLLLFWLMISCFLTASRLAMRFFLEAVRRRGRNLRHVLIVGTNSRAINFARKMQATPETGYRIIGFADETWFDTTQAQSGAFRLVCGLHQLGSFLRRTEVDDVVMGLPIRSYYEKTSAIAALCEVHGITVQFLPGLFNLKLAHATADEFEGDPIITLTTGQMNGWPIVLKRILDVVLSVSVLIVLSPLLLVAALLIKFTSPGPVLFKQDRLGLNKHRFPIYKFRTMVPDAEKQQAALERLNEQSGPVFKIRADPRITPIGKLLRKTSIDELPQLLNVLRGEMSLVGPRPLPVRDYESFDQDWHRRRFSVRPGITCLWQISGRNSIGFDRWMELDMQYIDEWSIWLDFRILAGTIPAVLRGTGAA